MGKHRNSKQDKIFLSFMTAHPDLARGHCKGDKGKWKELANLLNEAGPPTKDIFSWKKAWIDWKSTIRKKLHRNQFESRSSDGESEDKYGLSKIESSINFICDLENQLKKRDDSGEFVYETSNPFQSPISSPQPTKKRKLEGLREFFLEALNENSLDNSNCDAEIKIEKEDKSEGILDGTSNHCCSLDSSSNLTQTTTERSKKDNSAHSSKGSKEEKVKEFLENKLNNISQKLDELGEKCDILIALKKEEIEEMRRDRIERRRHNLEVEKYNDELLAIKTRKSIKSENR